MNEGRQEVVPAVAAAGTTPTGDGGGARGSGRLRPSSWPAWVFLLPTLVLLGAWVGYPIVYSLIRSLYDASGTKFVGGANYVALFSDRQTLTAIRNTAIWVAVAPAVVTAVGLIFAVLTERIRWAAAFKLIAFMPMAVSFLASGVIFEFVYQQNPDQGVANAVITAVHDVFTGSSPYPGAHPRPDAPLVAQGQDYASARAVRPGQAVLLPLVGVQAADLPAQATAARAATARPGAITGTVWLDFTRGGGTPGRVDAAEKGMPAVTVQAVRNGTVVATTKTRGDGTFALNGLPAGSYTLRLPASNFAPRFTGVDWLGDAVITPAIIGAYVWVWAGFAMVLIAAGLAAIPRDALEAARVDGATEWQVFRWVTMPLLSPVLLVVFVTLVINVLKVFDLVYVIGYGNAHADVLATQMWRVSFGGGDDQGLGSALALFLFVLVLPAMIFNIRRFRRERP